MSYFERIAGRALGAPAPESVVPRAATWHGGGDLIEQTIETVAPAAPAPQAVVQWIAPPASPAPRSAAPAPSAPAVPGPTSREGAPPAAIPAPPRPASAVPPAIAPTGSLRPTTRDATLVESAPAPRDRAPEPRLAVRSGEPAHAAAPVRADEPVRRPAPVPAPLPFPVIRPSIASADARPAAGPHARRIAAPQVPARGDTIRVHIGRVDVRAVFPAPAPPPPRRESATPPVASLDRFLSRGRGER